MRDGLEPLAAELRRGIDPLLPEQSHISPERHSLSSASSSLAGTYFSAETERHGDVKLADVHSASKTPKLSQDLFLFVFLSGRPDAAFITLG